MARYKLAEARKILGLTVKQLAEESGVHTGTIHKIERENSEYKNHEVVAQLLADALGCEVDEIYWPNGLSINGRPPLTGGTKLTVTVTRSVTLSIAMQRVCPNCNEQLPMTGICDNCS